MGSKVGPWEAYYTCVSCDAELGKWEMMHVNGICPHCGRASNSTICDTNKKAYREIRQRNNNPWWMFWNLFDYSIEYKET